MRTLVIAWLAFGVGGSILFGCGDDTSGAGGNGQGGDATGAAGPTSTGPASGTGAATSSSSSTSSTGGNGGGDEGGGGNGGGCTEITAAQIELIYSAGPFAYRSNVTPALGGADEDVFQLEIYDDTTTGAVDLGAGDQANYSTCTSCVRVLEDVDMSGARAKQYFQESGSIDYGTTTPAFVAGTITNVKLVEVTVDPDTFESTPVPNGSCLHLASAPLAIVPPPVEWTCPPENYGDGIQCDCVCGTTDPDCANAALPIAGCEVGQTCAADGSACEGVPTAWTCPADQYGGGAGNGCDCKCGAHDPDCDIAGEPVEGCAAGETVCNAQSLCVPAAWTCTDTDFFGDGFCDCGCGVQDVDCADAAVGTCEYCDDAGSCSATACPGTINPTNNAVCG